MSSSSGAGAIGGSHDQHVRVRRRAQERGRRSDRFKAQEISVKIGVPLVGEISGTWRPDDVERQAAWELYVELTTRISVVELGEDEGLLREALSSFYTMFATTREILRRYGPAVAPQVAPGQVTFGVPAVNVLNLSIRPLLSRWHPLLTAHEGKRPGASIQSPTNDSGTGPSSCVRRSSPCGACCSRSRRRCARWPGSPI